MSEPVSSFADSIFTLAGFVLGYALGITRISYYKNTNLDIVPADLVVNHCIAAGWQTGETFNPLKTEVPVYNISSVMDNPITQDQVYDTCDYYARQVPSEKVVLYPLYFRTTCRYNYLFLRMIFHTLVAHFLDISAKMQGKKPMYVEAIAKLHKFQESYEYFTIRTFYLHVENTNKMLKKMSFKDRELFNFDVTTINWDNYFLQYCRGLRFYLLKDPIETVPQGEKHFTYLRRAFIFCLVIGTIFLYGLGKIFLFKVLPAVFGIMLYGIKSIVC